MKLTQTVQKGGCAAKVAAAELRTILSRLQFPPASERLMVDGAHFDDAAIYKVSDDIALVQTLDFFTPILDTPHLFGKVAAANSLSDVYAMGGEPQTAMAILAFPMATMDTTIASEVLQGACDILKEANASLCGGHSIDDDTLKFGLSVTGFVNPKKIWSNAGARTGDVLILTKALGTGAATAALKRQEILENDLMPVIESMAQLNRVLDLLKPEQADAIHAATDITGFGLLGHSMQMAKASKVAMEFSFLQIPQFEISKWALEKSFLTKAHRTNRTYTEKFVTLQGLTELQSLLLVDPQTSGGLLLSVAADQADSILRSLQSRFSQAAIIGQVNATAEPSIQVQA